MSDWIQTDTNFPVVVAAVSTRKPSYCRQPVRCCTNFPRFSVFTVQLLFL